MTETLPRSNLVGRLGLTLLVFSTLIYAGLQLCRFGLESGLDNSRFEQQLIREQHRNRGWAQVTMNTPPQAQHLVTVKQLLTTFTPLLTGAAAFGALLVATRLLRRKPQDTGEIKRKPPSSVNRRKSPVAIAVLITLGIVLLLVGGLWRLALEFDLQSAKDRDRRELESRTVRGVPSPYGGTMTVTYGSEGASRSWAANGSREAYAPLTLSIMGCGAGFMILATLLAIVSYRSSGGRAVAPSGTSAQDEPAGASNPASQPADKPA